MNVPELALAAVALAIASLLSWSQARRLFDFPYGTRQQRIASFLAALALVCAGWADRTYRQQLPSTIVLGTVEEIRLNHSKWGITRNSGTLELRSELNGRLSLTATDHLYNLKPGDTVRVFYDHIAMLIRTIEIVDSQGQTRARFDNQPTNRLLIGPWFFAAFIMAYTALPLHRRFAPGHVRPLYSNERDQQTNA